MSGRAGAFRCRNATRWAQKLIRASATIVIAALAAGSLSAGEVPERGEYAWRFPLSGGTGSEFRTAPIPLEVYRSVSDPALRDIGVYNAAGAAVPRMLQPPREPPPADERTLPLALVPLFGAPAAQREQLRLLMRQGAAGTTLSLDTASATAADADAAAPPLPRTAYLVDLRALEESLVGLRFVWSDSGWGDSATGFIGTVRVETSDDLQQWRQVARGTLADLAFAETQIEQDRLPLDGATGDYLRITWSGLPADWPLDTLSGIRQPAGTEEMRDWLELAAVSIEEDGRSLTFDADGYPPVDRVKLFLDSANVVVRAQVLYRGSEEAPWRQVHEGVFYHVSRDGQVLQSPAAAIAPVRASQWQVRIASGSADGGLRLQLGWRPERLLFLAQGEGPFELVTGRARDQAEDYPQQRLLGDPSLFRLLEADGATREAHIGARQALAGEAALQPDPRARWRTALVWTALIGAVLLVAWLALSLLRGEKSAT